MASDTVTQSNWTAPSFWSSIKQSSGEGAICNDFVDLSSFFNDITEVSHHWEGDGFLNHANTSGLGAVDCSDASQFNEGDGISFSGAARQGTTIDTSGVVCFTRGTAILTPAGEVLIEDLRVGDLVSTLDNGPQRLQWIGQREVSVAEMLTQPNLRPVRIQRGAMDNTRKLMVSRQHAMLLDETHFARSVHLTKAMKGVDVMRPDAPLTYIHLMFDAHEVVFVEGIASESFYPSPQALRMMGARVLAEVKELLPILNTDKPSTLNAQIAFGPPARAFLGKMDVLDWACCAVPEIAEAS